MKSLYITLLSSAFLLSAHDISLSGSSAFPNEKAAEKVCKVTDPTGAPLNIRAAPNGKIIGTIKNGAEVGIEDVTYRDGKAWARIGGYRKGDYKTLGFVIREFISCYER